jgi:hypothetical protein
MGAMVILDVAAVRARIRPLRAFVVLGLLGYPALLLVFAFARWLLPLYPNEDFTSRSNYHSFVNEWTIVAPVLAVLLATAVPPALGLARPIALVALGEYAAALLFGTLSFLVGMSGPFGRISDSGTAYVLGREFDALAYLVIGTGTLGLAALAGFVTLRALPR